ncbi:MAG TPA: IPTL-CTERM sorting domain-containing protein [Thermoanaerobaculia bacterium]
MRRGLVFLFVCLLSTAMFAQSADQQIVSVTESADPVVPGANYTYTIQIQNNGPNAATNGGVNIALDGIIEAVSTSAPGGWTCTAPAQFMSCTTPSFANGASATIVLTARVPSHRANFPDGTVNASFSTSGTTTDPNSANNTVNVSTAWDSPQIELGISSATDSPDPVTPDGNITYTVGVNNAGPDTATNLTFSVINSQGLQFQSVTPPAGWTCAAPAVGGSANFSCTKASLGVATDTFTVVLRAPASAFGVNDGTIQTLFQVGGTGNETAHGDETVLVTTTYQTPDADVAISVTDSPDPVPSNSNITYTVQVVNNGPDAAPNATVSFSNSQGLQFQSLTAPAGWTCNPPSVGSFISITCTNPSLANGATATFTLVGRADVNQFGVNEGTVQTVFQVSSSVADPVPGNNTEVEATAYTTPDADVAISVTDSPDPVAPDGNITYTVQVVNNGPDAAPNATVSFSNSQGLQFQSLSAPAGWTCNPPSVGSFIGITCTNPSLANGASATFTLVGRADVDQFGINDSTIQTVFSVTSSVSDPVSGNNIEVEATAYTTQDANLGITATDSPDPVVNGGTLTFTVNATNAGPDAAPNAQVTLAPSPHLTFQSITAPAGWNCTTPAIDAAGPTTCTLASFPSGGSASFTLVTELVNSGSGGTLESVFLVGSSIQDPVPANNEVHVFTNWVGQTTDLAISKNTLSSAAAQGEPITYNISTTNNGPDAASNVTVTDVLDAALLFQSITAPAGWNCTTPAVGTNGTVTCSIASLPNGTTANFTLVTTVAPNATGAITNSATVGGGGTDPTPGNGSGSSGSVVIAGDSDLGVTKTTTATDVAQGGTISYTINVTNAGPDAAASAVMTDVLPASLLFQSIAAPAGWTCTTPAVGANGTVTCNAATLANGATATFTLVATVAPSATGTITNTATAGHSGTDGNPGNSTGASAPTPIVVVENADLSVDKTTTATTAAPGGTFSYTISLTNNGPDAAANVVMTDILPADLQFVSINAPAGFTCVNPAVNTNGTVTCSAATLANGTTAIFTLTVRVSPSATSGTVTNGVTVTSATDDGTPGNDSDNAPAVPIAPAEADLSITKSTASTTATTGSNVTYTITVSNNGPTAATNVVVSDDLPAGLTFVSATPSQGTCNASDPISCNLGTLANGASATVTVVANVSATGGTIANTASVDGAETDPNGGNNSSTTPPIPVGPGGPQQAEAIPTMSEWALIAMAALLGLAAMLKMR